MNEISYFKELNNYEVLPDKLSDEELNTGLDEERVNENRMRAAMELEVK